MTAKYSPPLRIRARQTFTWWAISAALLLSAGAASASTLNVSLTPSAGEYATIQDAINAAANTGDTIVIADGTYTGAGNVDLDTISKNLTIQSDHGAASTIIDCGGSSSANHRGFYIHNGETVTLTGLTIENGYESNDNGGGVSIGSGNVTLTNCIVSGNSAGGSGGGIIKSSFDHSSMTLVNCLVSGNTTSNNGGGVINYGNSDVTVTNCTVSGNTAHFGGGIYNYSNSNVTLINSVFYSDNGGEIVNNGGILTLTYSDVQGGLPSSVSDGGGNINSDPQFVSATDFHIQPGSPCFAAGTSNGAPTADLDGITRPATPTVGAYEGRPAPVTLMAVTIAQAASSVVVGATDQFTATATYSDNTSADVTAQATWASDDTSKATVDAAGLATGVAAGAANIMATYSGVTSGAALTVTAAPVPVASGYQALWSASDGSFSVWDVALGGGFAAHDFDAVPGYEAQAVADTPDGHVHVLLTAADGAVQFEDADLSTLTRGHNSAATLSYGPFPGWTAQTLAAGPDGLRRVLWTRTDGMISLWKLQASGTYDHDEYGPYTDWTARLMTVAPDNTVRLVWSKTDGQMSFWVMDGAGGFAHTEYGAYPGWTPTALTASPGGMNLVSWTHTDDGKMSLWALQDGGQFTFADFGPFAGWTANSLTVGADSTLHVGWTQAGGAASLWDLSGTAFQFSVYGPYSA